MAAHPIAQLVDALKELPAVLEQQRAPDEIEEPATVQFGYGAVGKVYPRPGDPPQLSR